MPLITRPISTGNVATIYGRRYEDNYAKELNRFTDGYRIHNDVTGLKPLSDVLPSPLFTPSPSTHHSNHETDQLIYDHRYLSIRQCFHMLTQLTQYSVDIFQDLSQVISKTTTRIQQLQSHVNEVQQSVDQLNIDSQVLPSSTTAGFMSPGHPIFLHSVGNKMTMNSTHNTPGSMTMLQLDDGTLLDNSLFQDIDSPVPAVSNNAKQSQSQHRFSLKRSWTVTNEQSSATDDHDNNHGIGSDLAVTAMTENQHNHFQHFLQHKVHPHQQNPSFLDRQRIAKTLQNRIKSCDPVPALEALSIYTAYFRLNNNQRYFADRFSSPEFFLEQWFRTQEQRLISVENERKISKADKKKRFKLIRESLVMEQRRKSQIKQVVNWRDLFPQDGRTKTNANKQRRKSSLKSLLRRDSSSSIYSKEFNPSTVSSIASPTTSSSVQLTTASAVEDAQVELLTIATPISPLAEPSVFSPVAEPNQDHAVTARAVSSLSKMFDATIALSEAAVVTAAPSYSNTESVKKDDVSSNTAVVVDVPIVTDPVCTPQQPQIDESVIVVPTSQAQSTVKSPVVAAPLRRAPPPPPPVPPPQRVMESFGSPTAGNTPVKDQRPTVTENMVLPEVKATSIGNVSKEDKITSAINADVKMESVSRSNKAAMPLPPPPPPRKSILQDPLITAKPVLSTPMANDKMNIKAQSTNDRSFSNRVIDQDDSYTENNESDPETETRDSESIQSPISVGMLANSKTDTKIEIESSDDEMDFNLPVRAPSVVLSARASRYYHRSRSTTNQTEDLSVASSNLESLSEFTPRSPPPPSTQLPTTINFEAEVVNPADVMLVIPKTPVPPPPNKPKAFMKPPPPPPPQKRMESNIGSSSNNLSTTNRLLVKSIRLQTFADVLADTSSLPTPGKNTNKSSIVFDDGKGTCSHISAVTTVVNMTEEPKKVMSPLGGNMDLLAAIRRGSTLKKKESSESIVNNRVSTGSSSATAGSGNGFANSASVQAILERRKYIQEESGSSDDESDNDDW